MADGLVFSDYNEDERYDTRGRTVTNADIRMWIGATDGTHPNHVDREHCKEHPIFEDIVVPGLLTLSLADAFCAQEISQDAAFALNYGHDDVRYSEPVYVGDTITGEITIATKEEFDDTWGLLELDVILRSQDDVEVLTERHLMLVSRSRTL